MSYIFLHLLSRRTKSLRATSFEVIKVTAYSHEDFTIKILISRRILFICFSANISTQQKAAAVNVFVRHDMRVHALIIHCYAARANFQQQQRRGQFSGPNGGLDIC
jgi:hypothetical protein